MSSREPWMEFALCRTVDSEIFFPDKGGEVTQARKVCGSCTVRAECLAYSLPRDDYGLWAGLTRNERRVLRRKLKQGAA